MSPLGSLEVGSCRKTLPATLLVGLLSGILSGIPDVPARGDGPVTPDRDYVVLASRRCVDTDGWSQVAGALAAKHAAELLVFERTPEELLPELSGKHPRLVGVVAMPDEAGRAVVGRIHRMLRQLDEDPYLDARWGLITASDWPVAMEIVRAERPLRIASMLSNTPVPLEIAPDGTYFDEGVAGRRVERSAGGDEREIFGDPVTADDFVAAFDRLQPDLLVTSGRTNEERWMIGYTFDGGRVVVAEDGSLRARTPDGVELPISKPGPTAMLGAGSCLLGFVPGPGVLPLRFLEHAGVRQVFGYCSTTWHGAGGWDVYRRFLEEPGRHTMAETVWIAQQDLVRRYAAAFPGVPEVSTEGFDERAVPEFRTEVAARTGIPRTDDRFDDLSGYLWDRDALTLLGDPAWRVELDEGVLPWTATVIRDGDLLVIDLAVHDALEEKPTPAVLLEERIRPGRVIEDGGVGPVVLDDMVFFPDLDGLAAGERTRVVVEAPLVRARASVTLPTPEAIELVLGDVQETVRPALRRVVRTAGANGGEILAALESVPDAHRGSLVHLVANLPARDARELPATFLLDQVALAHESFAGSPWNEGVSNEIFLEAVLPHAHIDERRDDWRRDFTSRFRELAWEAPTQREAVRLLNRVVFETFDIHFDANKRLTNEQSPYQTIVQRCASCTGMSIMLANACRAAGIPARLAGIPEWPDGDNHTWVEVFDPLDGRWHWIEAFGKGDYDEGWWVEKVRRLAQSPSEDPRFRPWAVGWRRPEGVPDRFHLWWLTEDDDPIPAVDRSEAYAEDRSAL